VTAFGTSVERLHLNQTNPDPALGDVRSTAEAGPHPFLTNPVIGQAMSMAIDRALLVEVGYGAAGQPTCNVLPAPDLYASTANDACLTQDIPGAIALLDEAGIVDTDGDGIREYEGTPLSASSTRPPPTPSVRTRRRWCRHGGPSWASTPSCATSTRRSSSAAIRHPRTRSRSSMPTSRCTPTTSPVLTRRPTWPSWLCDDWPRPEHQWQGSNIQRFCDPEYDALVAEMAVHRRPRGAWPPCT
jgi:peptide/nickel transport system substrate-binding protein